MTPTKERWAGDLEGVQTYNLYTHNVQTAASPKFINCKAYPNLELPSGNIPRILAVEAGDVPDRVYRTTFKVLGVIWFLAVLWTTFLLGYKIGQHSILRQLEQHRPSEFFNHPVLLTQDERARMDNAYAEIIREVKR